jgi:polyisoprenoid-binding protein YceI
MSTSMASAGVRVYDLDPAHSSVHFSVRHMMISNVRGEFSKLTGKVIFDSGDPKNSKVEAAIDAGSIHTRDDQRDTHLKSADFLDVEHYPQILFNSTRVEQGPAGTYKVVGNLTIRGVSREVTLKVEDVTPEAKDPWGNFRMGGTATARIKRSDFGVTWNQAMELGGFLVGDELSITIDAELVRKPE